MRLNPDTGEPVSGSSSELQRGYGLHWRQRKGRGRLLKEAKPELHRDELLPREDCIAGLRKVCGTLPKGGKSPLARHLGITLVHLRNMLTGRAALPEACRRRVSRFLMQYARGEIECVEISPNASPRALWIAGKPSHAWRYTQVTYDRQISQDWLNGVQTEARKVVFHANLPARLFA